MERTNEELVADYLEGDEEAFAILTKQNLTSVYSFVVRFVGNSQDAEDVVQETFVKAWKNLGQYSRKDARFKTWLMRIARNTAIDFLRKRRAVPLSMFIDPEGESTLPELVDDGPLPEMLSQTAEDRVQVGEAIERLSPLYREVLLLYYSGDYTFEEIAEVLEVPANTIKSRHRRGLALLRKELVHLK